MFVINLGRCPSVKRFFQCCPQHQADLLAEVEPRHNRDDLPKSQKSGESGQAEMIKDDS